MNLFMKACEKPMPYPIIWIGITNKRNGKILGSLLLNEPRSDKIKSGDTNNKSTSNRLHPFCNVNIVVTIEKKHAKDGRKCTGSSMFVLQITKNVRLLARALGKKHKKGKPETM